MLLLTDASLKVPHELGSPEADDDLSEHSWEAMPPLPDDIPSLPAPSGPLEKGARVLAPRWDASDGKCAMTWATIMATHTEYDSLAYAVK